MYSGITSGRVLDGELLYTKSLEVNLRVNLSTKILEVNLRVNFKLI